MKLFLQFDAHSLGQNNCFLGVLFIYIVILEVDELLFSSAMTELKLHLCSLAEYVDAKQTKDPATPRTSGSDGRERGGTPDLEARPQSTI